MLCWNTFNCHIFISSQNLIIFPMPCFSAFYLVWWQWLNLRSILNLIYLFLQVWIRGWFVSLGIPLLEHYWHFLKDSVADKNWCELANRKIEPSKKLHCYWITLKSQGEVQLLELKARGIFPLNFLPTFYSSYLYTLWFRNGCISPLLPNEKKSTQS